MSVSGVCLGHHSPIELSVMIEMFQWTAGAWLLLACGVHYFIFRNFVSWLLKLVLFKKINCIHLSLNIIPKIMIINTQNSQPLILLLKFLLSNMVRH